jgi:hypothetical protein
MPAIMQHLESEQPVECERLVEILRIDDRVIEAFEGPIGHVVS